MLTDRYFARVFSNMEVKGAAVWSLRLKSFATWIGALVSGTALAFGAAIVTSGSLPVGSPLTSPSTSTTVVTSPTPRPVDHGSTTVVREEHVVVPTTTREHVATTVPSYSGYDENDEHHWGERNDEWEGREDD